MGGAQVVDIASYHLYHGPHPPESKLPSLLQTRADLLNGGYAKLPIWNTESGYWFTPTEETRGVTWDPDEIRNRHSDTAVAGFVVRDLVLARAVGYERFYWFAWDNNKMGLLRMSDMTVRPAGLAFGDATTLLTGALLRRCDRDANLIWTCQLSTRRSEAAQIMWMDPASKAPASKTLPSSGRLWSFDGQGAKPAARGQTVQLGPIPVLYEPGAAISRD